MASSTTAPANATRAKNTDIQALARRESIVKVTIRSSAISGRKRVQPEKKVGLQVSSGPLAAAASNAVSGMGGA